MGTATEKYLMTVERILAVICVTSFAGLCFQVVGIFGPAWVTNKIVDSLELQEGLWVARLCREKGADCVVDMREEVFKEIGVSGSLSPLEESHWTEFKVLSIASILTGLLCIVASVTALVKTVAHNNTRHHLAIIVAGDICAITSFTTLLVPILKITAIIHHGHITSGWSLFMGATGAALQFVVAVMLSRPIQQDIVRILRRKDRQHRRQERSRRNGTITRYLHDCTMALPESDTTEIVHSDVLRRSVDSGVSSVRSDAARSGNADNVSTVSGSVSRCGNNVYSSLHSNYAGSSNHGTVSSRIPPYSPLAALPSYSEVTGI